MKIISGYLKNKKIILPSDKSTRPLKSLVRESIFNIIEHSKLIKFKIENCEVLDLFSGSGSFGLECISRGAKKVLFCENYIPVTKILNKNIANLKCKKNTNIYIGDAFKLLNDKSFLINKFQIIFLDPPFKEKNLVNDERYINPITENKDPIQGDLPFIKNTIEAKTTKSKFILWDTLLR